MTVTKKLYLMHKTKSVKRNFVYLYMYLFVALHVHEEKHVDIKNVTENNLFKNSYRNTQGLL